MLSLFASHWKQWHQTWAKDPNRCFCRYLYSFELKVFVSEIAFHFDDEYQFYICDVAVKKRYRGRGFGKTGLVLLLEGWETPYKTDTAFCLAAQEGDRFAEAFQKLRRGQQGRQKREEGFFPLKTGFGAQNLFAKAWRHVRQPRARDSGKKKLEKKYFWPLRGEWPLVRLNFSCFIRVPNGITIKNTGPRMGEGLAVRFHWP